MFSFIDFITVVNCIGYCNFSSFRFDRLRLFLLENLCLLILTSISFFNHKCKLFLDFYRLT